MARNLAGTTIPPGNGGVVYPSPNEWPVTYVAVTNIVRGMVTKVTAPNHGITVTPNANVPGVDFSQVKGMSQINGKFGYVTQVIDASNLMVAIDSSMFSPYSSGGFMNIIAGSAPYDPLQNLFP